MPNCLTASVLFRAYLKRLPSGVFRVTVLSTLLPRPLFRSYPVELGEVTAVERSVRHALVVLKCARPVHGVDHLVMSPHADNYGDAESDSQCAEDDCKVESVFQHGSPHVVQQPSQHAAVGSAEQAGADGYAVNDGHGSVVPVKVCADNSPENAEASNKQVDLHYYERSAEPRLNQTEPPVAAGPFDNCPQPTQHLRLRVVWQGLL